jgi:pimeloyl-ACP methyl ester carboxylesterase
MRGALVLLHAFPLNARMWEPQLALADRGWRVITPQLAGFDETAELGSVGGQVPVKHKDTCPPDSGTGLHTTRGDLSPVSIDDYAGDVIDLLDALHIHEAVIGGLSMGGYVAFSFLRRHRSLVAGVILADTRAAADSVEVAARRVAQQRQVAESGTADLIENSLENLLSDDTKQNRPDVVERARNLMAQNPPAGVIGALDAMRRRPDAVDELAGIDVPVLVVVGAADKTSPPEVAADMAARLPDARLEVIPGAGHLSNLEAPEAFNAALISFLDDL